MVLRTQETAQGGFQPGWLGGGDQTSAKVLMKTGGLWEPPTDSRNTGVSYKPPGAKSANKLGWEARCSPSRERPSGRPRAEEPAESVTPGQLTHGH